MGLITNVAKAVALTSSSHAPTAAGIPLLAGFGVSFANADGAVVNGVQPDSILSWNAIHPKLCANGEPEALPRCLLL